MTARRTPPIAALVLALACQGLVAAPLRLHGIFSSHMVIQRGRPIAVWGWAEPGAAVSVRLGDADAVVADAGPEGRWEAVFPAREASAEPLTLRVAAGGESIELENIVVGDVWVMNGQSNMAFELGKTLNGDLEAAQADLPLLRALRINPNEQSTPQEDLPRSALAHGGWIVSTPRSAGGISAIGFAFGSRLQRALGIPVGLIDNGRGGASIESLVPPHKFAEDPLAARYLEWVRERQAAFDWDAALAPLIAKWEEDVAGMRARDVPEERLPARPTRASLRSWDVPGRSPSDAASCYNGMFGVFKGFHIAGVLFHQGYNNAMAMSCRPKRYRVLMRLMVEGWREDFGDPSLPVGVIGFCAGGIPQTRENFEVWSVAPGAYIREAQRLGLADVGDPLRTAFLPAYDVQIPGLHPHKKRDHGERAARWALNRVYGLRVNWETASLESASREGDTLVLTFDKPVMPDDLSTVPEGFSIAGADGVFHLGHARFPPTRDAGIWNTANKNHDTRRVVVWSPMVPEPVAVRYAWSSSPMGNLKIRGRPWLPLASFRTDDWDWPESEDPALSLVDRDAQRAMNADAEARRDLRRMEEARRAVEILERLRTLGRDPGGDEQAARLRRGHRGVLWWAVTGTARVVSLVGDLGSAA